MGPVKRQLINEKQMNADRLYWKSDNHCQLAVFLKSEAFINYALTPGLSYSIYQAHQLLLLWHIIALIIQEEVSNSSLLEHTGSPWLIYHTSLCLLNSVIGLQEKYAQNYKK